MDSFHQPWLTGVELLDDANRNKHVLPTGLEGYFECNLLPANEIFVLQQLILELVAFTLKF